MNLHSKSFSNLHNMSSHMNNVNVCSFVNVNGVTPTPFSLGPIPKHNSDYYNGFMLSVFGLI